MKKSRTKERLHAALFLVKPNKCTVPAGITNTHSKIEHLDLRGLRFWNVRNLFVYYSVKLCMKKEKSTWSGTKEI